jgi:hypothetical protein
MSVIVVCLQLVYVQYRYNGINIAIRKSYFLDAIRKREEKNIVRFDFFLSLYSPFTVFAAIHCMTVS